MRAFRREGACNTERAPCPQPPAAAVSAPQAACPHRSPPPPQVLKPAGQGPDGDPVLLFFDGHTSRWNMSALLYLERNNVHGICLPSHTSIWSQPNDAGANASFKAFFGVTLRQTRTNAQASANRAVFDTVHWPPASARVCTPRLFFFNTVIVRLTIRTPVLYMQAFRRAFIGWRHKLEEGLRSSKACNAIKSAWKTVRCVFQAAQLARAVPPRIPHRPCPPLLLLAADPHSSRSAAEPALHRAPRDRPSFRSPSSAPSPPSARQVGLGGRLNRQCDSWRDAIIAFGRLPHVPGSSDAEAAHDPAGDAAAPGTSVWEQAQQAAADRLRTRLSALVAGKSLQLRRVVLDSGGDGVDDYIPSASAATAVGLAEAVRISVEGDTEELILNHAQIVDPSDARMCKLLAEFQCADDTVDLRKLGRKEGARARNAREKLEREEAARQGRAASERAIAALKAEAMQAGVTDDLWSRVRAQFERPPPQVMGNLLVYDAVALTEPIVLTRATLEAVGGALAMGHEPDRQPRPRAPNRRTSGVPQTGRGGCIERLRAGMQEADAEKARKKARLDAQAQAEREAKQQEKAARERQVQLEREDRSRQAARKQSEKIEKEDEALKGQALKAFEWMRDSGVWEFEELTLRRRSILVRFFGGTAKKQPKASDDAELSKAWGACRPGVTLEEVRTQKLSGVKRPHTPPCLLCVPPLFRSLSKRGGSSRTRTPVAARTRAGTPTMRAEAQVSVRATAKMRTRTRTGMARVSTRRRMRTRARARTCMTTRVREEARVTMRVMCLRSARSDHANGKETAITAAVVSRLRGPADGDLRCTGMARAK